MPRRALWIIAALALSLACKSREDPGATGKKVTAESDYDATDPVVDENYRFRLDSPGAGWKLLRTADVRQLLPDAVAGLVGPAGQAGGVIIERAPGTLEQSVELISGAVPQAVVESARYLEFLGLPAHRTEFSAMLSGTEFRYVRVLFLREGYLYQVMAWGLANEVQYSELEPVISAFSLTEGEVRGPVDDRPPVSHADGPTWQIREGEFQSVVSGLRLKPSPGWRYLVGRELAQVNAAAELALTNVEHNAYVAVISERYGSGDPAALVATIRNAHDQNMGSPQVEATRLVAGRSVEFARYHPGGFDFLVGVIADEGAVIQLLAWYPEAGRESALALVEPLLAQMNTLSQSQRQALAEQLLAREGAIRKVGPTSAYQSDQFRDFTHLITWTRPPGLFDVHVGDELAGKPNVVFAFEAPLDGVFAELSVFESDGQSADVHHEDLAGTFRERRDELGTIDGNPVRRSFGIRNVGGQDFRFAMATGAHHGHAVSLAVWSAIHAGSAETLAAALDGLGLPESLPQTSSVGGRFNDHRFGVSLDEAGSAEGGTWARSDATPSALGQARVTVWKKGRSEVSLMSMSSDFFPDDEEWMASFMEQTLRDGVAKDRALGKPDPSRSTLAGRPSRRLAYPDAELEVAVWGDSLTMLIFVEVDDDLRERLRSSLRWTDE